MEPTGPIGDEPEKPIIREWREVDLLFVIDNSGSMAVPQARLARAIAALVAVLDSARADYRIGVTTTDSGNPRCPAATVQPEGGALVLSSCLDRVDQGEFTFNGEDFAAACTDACDRRDADLVVQSTVTEVDTEARPRRWVESSAGELNIVGASAAEALQCYLPQGVAGCGFESPLESMYLALAQASDADSEGNYGFLRERAQLSLVLVSDETDCSYNPATQEIFTTNKVFWSDPENDVAPTSAVCWGAGVACSGGPGVYSECHAENHDLQGAAGATDEQAVLRPLARYVDLVRDIERVKQDFDADARVQVALLTGVPVGYEQFAAELVYEDAGAAEVQHEFGVGPGCVVGDVNSPSQMAVPPVREREFAEAFTDPATRRLYSLCEADYGAALAAIGGSIADALVPSCMPNCVLDLDPGTDVVEPDCQLFERDVFGKVDVEIPACGVELGAWVMPEGTTVCFGVKVDLDGKQTPEALDDMSPRCVEEGFNLEFQIVRTAPRPADSTITAQCQLSPDRKVDCPLL
jgi:hypothetical protein